MAVILEAGIRVVVILEEVIQAVVTQVAVLAVVMAQVLPKEIFSQLSKVLHLKLPVRFMIS